MVIKNDKAQPMDFCPMAVLILYYVILLDIT